MAADYVLDQTDTFGLPVVIVTEEFARKMVNYFAVKFYA